MYIGPGERIYTGADEKIKVTSQGWINKYAISSSMDNRKRTPYSVYWIKDFVKSFQNITKLTDIQCNGLHIMAMRAKMKIPIWITYSVW